MDGVSGLSARRPEEERGTQAPPAAGPVAFGRTVPTQLAITSDRWPPFTLSDEATVRDLWWLMSCSPEWGRVPTEQEQKSTMGTFVLRGQAASGESPEVTVMQELIRSGGRWYGTRGAWAWFLGGERQRAAAPT